MKAICIDKFVNEYDELQVSEVPIPQPKEGEVLVKIFAAGVNFVDLLYAKGKHQNNRTLHTPPFNLGLEFSGVIITSSPSSPFQKGTRVFGSSLGSYAQYICISPSALQPIPPSWSFLAAATLPATAPVSYAPLILRAGLKRGQTVLVLGASGGLGAMAVQIGKAVGAKVVAVVGSEEKKKVVGGWGADFVVGYEGEWWKRVLEFTGGEGVDVVFDAVGRVQESIRCTKRRGKILIVGFAGRDDIEKLPMNRVLLKEVEVMGYLFGETGRKDPAENVSAWKGVMDLIESGILKPTIFDKEYNGLETVKDALNDLKERKVWGKAVVKLLEEEEGNAETLANESRARL